MVDNGQSIGPREVSSYSCSWFTGETRGLVCPVEILCMCVLPLDVQPPEGRSRDGLLTVNLREGTRLHLCAETRDDAL